MGHTRPETTMKKYTHLVKEKNKYHTGKAGGFITALKGILPAYL